MRDELLVCAIAAVLSKRLRTEVGILQGPRYTEWRVGDKGFAVGPTPTSYPLRKLVDTLEKYFTPPMPVKRITLDEDHTQIRSNPAVPRKGASRSKGAGIR